MEALDIALGTLELCYRRTREYPDIVNDKIEKQVAERKKETDGTDRGYETASLKREGSGI